jgi:hypothetical protein
MNMYINTVRPWLSTQDLGERGREEERGRGRERPWTRFIDALVSGFGVGV